MQVTLLQTVPLWIAICDMYEIDDFSSTLFKHDQVIDIEHEEATLNLKIIHH